MVPGPAISLRAYQRITRYLNFLNQAEGGDKHISATRIAHALKINDVVVRKDLAAVSGNGKTKVGYARTELTRDIERFLGYDRPADSALAGVGRLGQALLSYENFKKYGLNITAAFDTAPELVGREINGVKILDASKITDLCRRLHIKIGIIAVPASAAQAAANALVEGGARAIWNFAPRELSLPEGVSVKHEDMAASLAVLTKQLERF
ncbi:MAG: redox-sensing transcriptional repressor Rex [Deltaproteobacteria bacterium]|nr:redox-sensing transcriptional repressor Rex [Deltaproteobacteria bacterium]